MDQLQNKGKVKRLLNQYMKYQQANYIISSATSLNQTRQQSPEGIDHQEANDIASKLYMTEPQIALFPPTFTVNDVNYDKRSFIPFKEERDHLGRLINSVSAITHAYPPPPHSNIRATCRSRHRSSTSRST